MKNVGLFSSLFLEKLKAGITLDDAAKGRMATLAHSLLVYRSGSTSGLWDSFLKQAVSYLEFVPPAKPEEPGVYPLYDDFGYRDCVAVLYLAPDGEALDLGEVGRFYPAKLVRELRRRGLSWGILTNGSLWRLYSLKTSRPYEDFVELDLSATLAASDEAEYGLFERFFHKDSFLSTKKGKDDKELPSCRLDSDRSESETVLDTMVKKPFLAQVDEVLQYICNGFIYDTRKAGNEYTEEERKEIFASAVKLIYRALFLFYAEARRLLPSDPDKADLYRRHSIRSLCEEARKFRWGQRQDTDQYDLWQNLKGLTSGVNDGDPEYGIMGYNGGLFDDEEERFLRDHRLRNDFLARALYLLAYVEPFDTVQDHEYAIPYEDLEVRHLGELYENILEFTVVLSDADRIRRRTKKGVEVVLASGIQRQAGDSLIKKGEVYFGESALERKQTGSYYTPESLVRFLNQKSITAPLNERFEQGYRKRFDDFIIEATGGGDPGTRRGAAESAAALVNRFAEEDVLAYSVCDPAMGSGHFLVDAANQMTGVVISLLSEVPRVDGMKSDVSNSPNVWRRRITRHCLYGVDLNLLAVNLAKLSLWLNCFASEHKLTFLDHHLRCGNSLIGIRDLGELKRIPKRKKDGKKSEGGTSLFDVDDLSAALKAAAGGVAGIAAMDEDDTDRQRAALHGVEEALARTRPLADLYTAYLMNPGLATDEYRQLFQLLAKGKDASSAFNLGLPQTLQAVQDLRRRHDYFHWPLEFPEVFGPDSPGGFNATVGNPPWDIVKPNSQEFFSDYDPQFRTYDKQKANKAVASLLAKNPAIAKHWQDYGDSFTEQSAYLKEPTAYAALGKGDINTFKIFLERFFSLLKKSGQMGIIVPSGIYTDQGCQPLREMFFTKSAIDFLYCFENRNAIFNIHRSFKFVLFGTCKGGATERFKCAFMEHDPERLLVIEQKALQMGVDQVKKFSPDTLSVMEFKSQRELDLIDKVYGNNDLLEKVLLKDWKGKFSSEFHTTNDNYLFYLRDKIEKYLTLVTPMIFKHENGRLMSPLYEGKMIWNFDPYWSQSHYFIDRKEASTAAGHDGNEYRVGYRRISASTNERTLVSSLLPRTFHAENIVTLYSDNFNGIISLCALMNSFSADFIIRQKISSNINMHFLKTLPLPPIRKDNDFLISRILRLICTKDDFSEFWHKHYSINLTLPNFWYPSTASIDSYGPAHEQEIRKRLRDEAASLTPEWGPHCGVHDRLPDRRDTGDRAQLRAEIDAYVAHLYGLSRDDFAYILDTFPVLKSKEKKAFGEFMSKRKCLEEYDRIGKVLG